MFFVFFKFTWICGVPRAAHLCKCERFFTFQGEFLVQDMKEKKKKPEHFSAEGYGIQRKQFFLTQCKAHNGAVMNEMGFL